MLQWLRLHFILRSIHRSTMVMGNHLLENNLKFITQKNISKTEIGTFISIAVHIQFVVNLCVKLTRTYNEINDSTELTRKLTGNDTLHQAASR